MPAMKCLIIRLLRMLRMRNPQHRTFLIPAYAGLGNFIMMTSMILALKRRLPDARIYLLTWPSYGTDQVFDAPVLSERKPGHPRLQAASQASHPKFNIQNPEPSPPIVSGIFLLDPSAPLWRKVIFFLRLRRWRFETAFIPFDACPPFVWWGFALAGCSQIFGHTLETMGIKMGWTKSVLDKSVAVDVGSHESDIHLDLLDAVIPRKMEDGTSKIGEPVQTRDYATHASASGAEVLEKYGLRERSYIVVQLSAANARLRTPKLWDRDRFADVITRLEAEGETIVLPGDENEKSLVDNFVEEHGLHSAVNIAGCTTVREISTVIKYARLLLVHDSGLMHIGNAHGTPLVALYGPTDWNFTAPKAQTSHILRKNLACQPCMAKMAKDEIQALRDCPIGVQCMRDITVDDVHAACRRILGANVE